MQIFFGEMKIYTVLEGNIWGEILHNCNIINNEAREVETVAKIRTKSSLRKQINLFLLSDAPRAVWLNLGQ